MTIRVRNRLVDELLGYLEKQEDDEAQELYQQLLQDKVEQEREDMKIEGTLPTTKGGAYIIGQLEGKETLIIQCFQRGWVGVELGASTLSTRTFTEKVF